MAPPLPQEPGGLSGGAGRPSLTQNECTVTRKSIWIFKNVCISFIKITKPLNLLQTNKARAFLRTNFTKLKFWPRLHLMFNQISCHCLLTPNLFQSCLGFFFLKEVILEAKTNDFHMFSFIYFNADFRIFY